MRRSKNSAYLLFSRPAAALFFLIKSPYNIVTCMDRSAADFLKDLHPSTYFMPHAVEKDIVYNPDQKRPYDVLLLGTCIDFESIAESWRLKYPKPLVEVLLGAAEITFSDQETSFHQAFIQTLDIELKAGRLSDIRSFNIINILNELEMYVRGYDRARFIRSIRDARIDIFGNTKSDWQRCLKNPPNCVFHEPAPFLDAIELMKKSKIVINNCIAIKAGAHERIYTGLAAGALVVTSENNYLKETFTHDKNIVFYSTGQLDQVNETINALLNDEDKRAAIAKAGHETVMKHHTWDNRVQTLLNQLNHSPPSFHPKP